MICDDKAACRAIDEELGKGGSAGYIARLMTLRGFSVTDRTITEHKKHATGAVTPGIAKTRKDFAIMVRDKAAELFEKGVEIDPETGVETGGLSLLNKDHVPGITAGLKAQSELNKQANKSDDRKTAIALAFILSGASGGGPPEHLQIDDGRTIEGEFEEVESEE